MRGIPSFVCYVSMIMVADCVLLSKDTEDYINGCIEMFLKTPKCPFFDAIVNPPRIGPSDEASIEAFFLPKILIWCPMTRWQLNLECPSHKKALKPSYFMNSNQVWRQPRLIYDLPGNVVLISRTYICQTQFRCRFRSTDDIIIQQIPAYVNIPFVLSYRSGVSEELMNYLYCQIGTGVTFSEISNMISELNSAEYLIQMKQYLLRNIHQIEMNAYDTLEYPDWCQQLFSAPSRDMLQSVFLKDFYTLKFCFEKEMHGLSATSISTDHTFKICKNIGIIDTDNNWIKQYPNLFLVLNQKGQVISWALTKSTSFEEVRSVFSNIRERLLEQSVCLTSAYIDNCCAWKSKLHSEFGPGLKVKLDLFHAVQRFTSTVPKRGVTSLRYDMFQDFTLIFRENDDQGKTRLKTTPDQSTILKNLENFKTKWTSVLLTHGEGPLKALKNLEQHISAGCLSEIEQGRDTERDTERNENLHKILNSSVLSHARTLGPELAFAVLTILFFTMNKQISGNRFHSRNFLKLKYLKQNPVQCPESFGFICKDKNILSNHRSEVVHITDSHFEEGADNICEGIISHSESLYNVLKNIETHCFSRNIDVSRLPLIYNKQHLCFLNSVFNNGGKSTAFGLTQLILKEIDDLLIQSSFSRSGLLAHLASNEGKCIIAYEEMDAFFSSVNRGQKDGTADRSFFCEMYDGTPQTLIRATADGKKSKIVTTDISLSVAGFHQPLPFLKEHFDVVSRRDGFMERFVLACPRPVRLLPAEQEDANAILDMYSIELHDFKTVYRSVYNYHLLPREYRLSEPALQIYNKELCDQAEAFNAMIEQRLEGHGTEEGSSKCVRNLVKLAGCLHILENVFCCLNAGLDIDVPEEISPSTTNRALALTRYSQTQKEILFKKDDSEEDVPATGSFNTYLKRRVLEHPGNFVTARNVVKKVSTRNRTEAQENIEQILQELVADDFGHWLSDGKIKCFCKNRRVDDAKLEQYGVSGETYNASFCIEDKLLSENQTKVFIRLKEKRVNEK